jgi:hypothetical protein
MISKLNKIQYGIALKKSGAILTFSVRSNEGGDFCGDTQTELQDPNWGGQQWLVDQLWHAEWVRTHSTPWYNASYDTPTNDFKADDLVVVKVTSIVEIESADIDLLASDEKILRWSWRNEPAGYDRTVAGMKDYPHKRIMKQFLHDAVDYYRTWGYYSVKDKKGK